MKQQKKSVIFVTDSHMRMPRIGLEKLDSLLANLTEDKSFINEILPKVRDIKTEVINTTDIDRQIEADFADLKNNFSNAVMGLDEAGRTMSNEANISHKLTSFRFNTNFPSDSTTH